MRKSTTISLPVVMIFCACCVNAYAAEIKSGKSAAAVKDKEAVVLSSEKKMTAREIKQSLDEIFKSHPDLLSLVGGMQASQDNGVITYSYQGKKLDELDEGTLSKILGIARQQLSLENMKRIEQQQRQMRAIKQINDMNRQQRAARQANPNMPKTPKTYNPPKIPKTYKPAGKI